MDRFIRELVKAGYGDYEAAASANIVDAAVFLYLGQDKRTLARKILSS